MPGALRRLLFPRACPICGSMDEPQIIEAEGCCSRCGKTYRIKPGKNSIYLPEFAAGCIEIICALKYEGQVREALHKYKFQQANYIGRDLGTILCRALERHSCLKADTVLTWVPVSSERYKDRGFDQSYIIAGQIALLAGLEPLRLFERDMQGSAQSSLILTERIRVSDGRFSISPDAPDISGKTILIIDDILTSGSTLEECAQLLLEQGAGCIIGAAAATGRAEFK